MTQTDTSSKPECKYCHGKGHLTQFGILRIYIFPHKISLLLIVAGIVLGIVFSKNWFFLCVAGYIMPLVLADLRMLLYPFVAVRCLFGAKAACPKCEPGSIFWVEAD